MATSTQPIPVFEVPVQPGSTIIRGGLAAAALASQQLPTLDLRDLPRPPQRREEAPTLAP